MARIPYAYREALWFLAGCLLMGGGLGLLIGVLNQRVP